ncbi:hypothetical protein M409DRAFT_59054 [Zasmidium cellare ATCC 36951]|uniref:F-box domain-containing protein n=1 Tax=Zasmidium cellare ATCC 36951 TaxID=1080233 RepID=A0A6A6C3J4_ZASCE|nr:uncharacterized protein M409DRAFT_59054 [Zasmidium cellare ATCC 36951]KAF2161674.1 hypothetical protein M409DRAFT_59054 [Zasmidium cellare ATCC 36951]
MANITPMEQQKPCRLLDLPPELRLMIWEAYFNTDLITEVAQHPHSRTKAVSLLSTCHTVFHEATPVYTTGLEQEVREMNRVCKTQFNNLMAKTEMASRNGFSGGEEEVVRTIREHAEYSDKNLALTKFANFTIKELDMLELFAAEGGREWADGGTAEADQELLEAKEQA